MHCSSSSKTRVASSLARQGVVQSIPTRMRHDRGRALCSTDVMTASLITPAQLAKLLENEQVDDAKAHLEESLKTLLGTDASSPATVLLCLAVNEFVSHGHAALALRMLDHFDEATTGLLQAGNRGKVLAARASTLRALGRSEDAHAITHDALEQLQYIAPPEALTALQHDQAVLCADMGDLDAAIDGLVAAREAFLGLRDRVGVAACNHNLSFVLHDLGAYDDALEYLTEARDIFLAIDMPHEAASCDQNLGVILYDMGRLEEAGRRFAVAQNRFTKTGALSSAAECDANLSALLKAMGHDDEAERYRLRAEQAGVGLPTTPGTSSQIPVVKIEKDSAHG